MKKEGFIPFKNGIWEEYEDKTLFRREMKATEWAFERIKEAFELVAQDEARKVRIVQEIMIKSTDYLRRITAPVGGHGGVTMSHSCPHCNSFPLEDYIWWVSGRKGSNKWWCAICGEKLRLEATKQVRGCTNGSKC